MFKNKSSDWRFGFWFIFVAVAIATFGTLLVLGTGESEVNLLPDSECVVVEYNDPSVFGDDVTVRGVFCPEPVK